MQRLLLITTLFIAVAFPQMGLAVVDMKNANYSDSWVDLQFNGTGYALKVQRFYNSRSTFSGIFGFGWCSEFESNIEITPEGRLSLLECGAGQETVYSPAKYDAKAQTKLIDELVAHYRKSTPGATEQGANTLREQLAQSTELRAEWAKDAKLAIPDAKKGTVYTADNLEVDKIVFDGSTYTRTLADGTVQKFNSGGHLIMMGDKNGNNLKFTYKGDNLSEIVDNTGKKLTFSFAQNKRVKEITGPGGATASGKFN